MLRFGAATRLDAGHDRREDRTPLSSDSSASTRSSSTVDTLGNLAKGGRSARAFRARRLAAERQAILRSRRRGRPAEAGAWGTQKALDEVPRALRGAVARHTLAARRDGSSAARSGSPALEQTRGRRPPARERSTSPRPSAPWSAPTRARAHRFFCSTTVVPVRVLYSRGGDDGPDALGFFRVDRPGAWRRPVGFARPELLALGVERCPGSGRPRRRLRALGLETVGDVLLHRPRRYERPADELPTRAALTSRGRDRRGRHGRCGFAVAPADGPDRDDRRRSGSISATVQPAVAADKLKAGTAVRLRGRLGRTDSTSSHTDSRGTRNGRLRARYPASEQVPSARLRRARAPRRS